MDGSPITPFSQKPTEIEQLELALEDLLIAAAESATADKNAADNASADASKDTAEHKPRRRPRVSDATPRERRELDPGTCCPDCGGDLRFVGEDVSEMLDLVAAQLKVLQGDVPAGVETLKKGGVASPEP